MEEMSPGFSPEASAWSIMWFSSLMPMDSIAGPASISSRWKRLSLKSSTGV